MVPVLFPSDAKTFGTNGSGVLADCTSCIVTQELNGQYELKMQYPISGVLYKQIRSRSIIVAKPDPYSEAQPFRVYRIESRMNGICTYYARHISYDLAGVVLNPFTAGNVADALAGFAANAEGDNPFTFWTDKETVAAFAISEPGSVRSAMGGREGSILDVYGGEWQYDNFTVKLRNHIGADNGVKIEYGKNLIDATQEQNIENLCTGIYPYWSDIDGGSVVTCDPKIVPAPGTYNYTRIRAVDFSADFETTPTPEQLQSHAEAYVTRNKIGIPKVSVKAEFVRLEQSPEYEDLQLLERCRLGDTVTVLYADIGVDCKARIIRTEHDVLLDRYKSVDIGEVRANIADTIAGQQSTIDRVTNPTVWESAVLDVTQTITGARGGYVVLNSSTGGRRPDEILIMDSPDIMTAVQVWRWNRGGLGFSGNGYNGPYTTAITQDGKIVADFIAAGTLNAALIKVVNLIADKVRSEKNGGVMTIEGAEFKLSDADGVRAKIAAVRSGLPVLLMDNNSGSEKQHAELSPNALYVGGTKDAPAFSVESLIPDPTLIGSGSEMKVDRINPGKKRIFSGQMKVGFSENCPGAENYDLFAIRMGSGYQYNTVVLAYKLGNVLSGCGGSAGKNGPPNELYFFTGEINLYNIKNVDASYVEISESGSVSVEKKLEVFEIYGII